MVEIEIGVPAAVPRPQDRRPNWLRRRNRRLGTTTKRRRRSHQLDVHNRQSPRQMGRAYPVKAKESSFTVAEELETGTVSAKALNLYLPQGQLINLEASMPCLLSANVCHSASALGTHHYHRIKADDSIPR